MNKINKVRITAIRQTTYPDLMAKYNGYPKMLSDLMDYALLPGIP